MPILCQIYAKMPLRLDKAPRLGISIVIWILSSETICQLIQFNTNSEAAMLSIYDICILNDVHNKLHNL